MESTATPARASRPRDAQGFLTRVFGWMFARPGCHRAVAGLFGSNDSLLTTMTENPLILIGVFVASARLVVTISAAINKLSPAVALTLFFLYAATVGRHLCLRLRALHGAVDLHDVPDHRRDVRRGRCLGLRHQARPLGMGTVLLMALFGLILAHGRQPLHRQRGALLDHHLRGRGDLRRAHRLRHAEDQGLRQRRVSDDAEQRASILGALALYLDFINLFLFLLRIFGQSALASPAGRAEYAVVAFSLSSLSVSAADTTTEPAPEAPPAPAAPPPPRTGLTPTC